MKYAVGLAVGFALGAVLALCAVYYNPLSGAAVVDAPADAWTLAYEFPGPSVVALAHGGQLRLPQVPHDAEPLWEAALRGTVLGIVALEDSTGTPRALASHVSISSTRTDLLLTGVVVDDYWLISIPDQGSLLVAGDNNLWPLLRDTFLWVSYLGREWRGPTVYPLTSRFGSRDWARVYGISGDFSAARGRARETYAVERFSAAQGIEALRGTLDLAVASNTVAHESSEVAGAQ